MFERLARQDERGGTVQTQTQDVFREATDEELRHKEQSESNEKTQTSLPVNNQVTSSTEVNSQQDVEMKEDEKGGVICWHQAKGQYLMDKTSPSFEIRY